MKERLKKNKKKRLREDRGITRQGYINLLPKPSIRKLKLHLFYLEDLSLRLKIDIISL